MPESLTACVIACDEEERLPDCLASLHLCDEVIVVDSGSRDATVEIARSAGARVVENPWPGFAAQRNFALDHASGDWVLEIDADERVTPELAREIRALLSDPPAGLRMAAIPRREIFLGRALGPSARSPRYNHRLFRRGAFRHDERRVVHEGLWPDGPTIPLDGELKHLLASSWAEALGDARAYARLEAAQRGRLNVAAAPAGVLLRPAAKLAYRVLLYGAWRDGWRGMAKVWIECAADSLAALYRLRGSAPDGAEARFGQQPPRLGPVRLVGVALGPKPAQRLEDWLAEAAAAGADVSLISNPPPQGKSVRGRALGPATPGAIARALDAEDQLRPIDAIVPAGWRERLLVRMIPGALRGAVPPLDPDFEAAEATRIVHDRTRSGERRER